MTEIETLQTDMTDIKDKLSDVYDILAQVNENIKNMNLGLYGDEKNNHIGVIQKQKDIEIKIIALEKEIKDIKEVNDRQEVAIKAKKSYLNLGLEILKWVALAYLAAKGIFGFDNLFGKFF